MSIHFTRILMLVSYSEPGYCDTLSNLEGSKQFVIIVASDQTYQFRDGAKMNYAYVGQRSRSK